MLLAHRLTSQVTMHDKVRIMQTHKSSARKAMADMLVPQGLTPLTPTIAMSTPDLQQGSTHSRHTNSGVDVATIPPLSPLPTRNTQ